MKIKTNTRRIRRHNSFSKPLAFATLGILLAAAGVNIAQNLQSSATSDAPGWGNDGLGVIFTGNYIKDENGNLSKRLSTANYGDTVEYSLNLDAKQRVNEKVVAGYAITLSLEPSLTLTSEPTVMIGDQQLSSNDYYYHFHQDIDTGKTEVVIGLRWADYNELGECRYIPMTNIGNEYIEWLKSQGAPHECSDGYAGNGYFDQITSIHGDDAIKLSVSAVFDNYYAAHVESGKVTADYDYLYFDDAGVMQSVENVNSVDAVVYSSALLIRKVDDSGAPIPGVVFAVDGVRADNYNGVYYASQDGMYGEFKANEAGEVLIRGLAFGDYTIRELEVPEGYEKSDSPIVQTVSSENMKSAKYTAQKLTQVGDTSVMDEETRAMMTGILDNLHIMILPDGSGFSPNDTGPTQFIWDESTQKYLPKNGNKDWYIERDENMGNASNQDSNGSYSERNGQYIVHSAQDAPGIPLQWWEEAGLFFGAMRFSEIGQDFGFRLVEDESGTLTLVMTSDSEQTRLVGERQSENTWIIRDGEATIYITREQDVFFLSADGMVMPLTYSESDSAYTYDPSAAAFIVKEHDDGSIEHHQGAHFAEIADNVYSGILIFFPLTYKYSTESTLTYTTELTIVNRRINTGQPPISLPETIISNPQTSDTIAKIICVAIAVSVAALIVKRQLTRR